MGPVPNSDSLDSDALFELEPGPAEAVGFAELASLPLNELVAPDWAEALAPVEGQLREVLDSSAGKLPAATRSCRRRRTSCGRSGSRWRMSGC